jgi:hypothetical protein
MMKQMKRNGVFSSLISVRSGGEEWVKKRWGLQKERRKNTYKSIFVSYPCTGKREFGGNK